MMREVITSRQNPLLVHARKLLRSRSYREKSGEFIADGTKLLEEAAKWCKELKTVIVQTGVQICALPAHVRVVEVSEQLMHAVSDMESPQGALFICGLPEKEQASLQGRCVILDGIQDPGNMGTILRTADALEIPVVLTDGCADAYNPKVVRATMGAVFRTPPSYIRRDAIGGLCAASGVRLLATAMSDDAKDIRETDLSDTAVVIGSEGQGVSRELFDASSGKIIIPMNQRCESLNAATAATIVMWQMKR